MKDRKMNLASIGANVIDGQWTELQLNALFL